MREFLAGGAPEDELFQLGQRNSDNDELQDENEMYDRNKFKVFDCDLDQELELYYSTLCLQCVHSRETGDKTSRSLVTESDLWLREFLISNKKLKSFEVGDADSVEVYASFHLCMLYNETHYVLEESIRRLVLAIQGIFLRFKEWMDRT